MKDDFRLLIKATLFIQHLILKDILLHDLYSMWKTFSLLYKLSTVNPLCCGAAYDSCGASLRLPHTDQHLPVNPSIARNFGYPVGLVTK